MQYIKSKNTLIYTVTPLVILIGIYLCWHYFSMIPIVFNAFWITTLLVILLVMTPLGSIHLSQNHDEVAKRIPPAQWLSRIFLLTFSLFGSFAGICLVSEQLLPVASPPLQLSLFAHFLNNMMHFGLFPWPLYALITVSMCALAYKKQTDAYFGQLLLNNNQKNIFSSIANAGAKRGTLFILGVSLMFFSFLILSIFISLREHLGDGFQAPAFLTTLVIFLLMYTNIVKNYITRLFSRKITTMVSIPLFCLLFGVGILLINTTMIGITHNIPPANTTIPPIIQWIKQLDWQTSWVIFSFFWWLCLTIAVCGYLANISKGYRVREVILAMSVLPILIGFSVSFFTFTIPLELVKLISVISFFILFSLLVNHQTSANIIMAYFPKNGVIKPRDHVRFFQNMTKMSALSLYFYFVLGINGLNLLLFLFNYLLVIGFLMAGICAIIYVFPKTPRVISFLLRLAKW